MSHDRFESGGGEQRHHAVDDSNASTALSFRSYPSDNSSNVPAYYHHSSVPYEYSTPNEFGTGGQQQGQVFNNASTTPSSHSHASGTSGNSNAYSHHQNQTFNVACPPGPGAIGNSTLHPLVAHHPGSHPTQLQEPPSQDGHCYGNGFSRAPSQTTQESAPFLDYPSNYFHRETDQVTPKTPEEAKKFWKFRRERTQELFDHNPTADEGQQMLKEMEDLRQSLRTYVTRAFYADAREMARTYNLTMPRTGAFPITPNDFVDALCALKQNRHLALSPEDGTLSNEAKAYLVLLHFHQGRKWLARTVDAWTATNRINIVFVPNEKTTSPTTTKPRKNVDDRGGFTAVAKYMKNEITKNVVRNMLSKAKWAVANRRYNKDDSSNKIFEKVVAALNVKDSVSFYVVTHKLTNADGTASASLSKPEPGASNPAVNVDFLKHFAQKYGWTVTDEMIQENIADYTPSADAILGISVAPGGGSQCADSSELTNETVNNDMHHNSIKVSASMSNSTPPADYDLHVWRRYKPANAAHTVSTLGPSLGETKMIPYSAIEQQVNDSLSNAVQQSTASSTVAPRQRQLPTQLEVAQASHSAVPSTEFGKQTGASFTTASTSEHKEVSDTMRPCLSALLSSETADFSFFDCDTQSACPNHRNEPSASIYSHCLLWRLPILLFEIANMLLF